MARTPLSKDIQLLESIITPVNERRINRLIDKLRSVLYKDMIKELQMAGVKVPYHIDSICGRCRAWDPTTIQTNHGPRCQKCITFTSMKYRYLVMVKRKGKQPVKFGEVGGETIPDAVFNFGNLARLQGFTIVRHDQNKTVYLNPVGDILSMSEGKLKK